MHTESAGALRGVGPGDEPGAVTGRDLATLRGDLAELRRLVAQSDHEIDDLKVKAAMEHGPWYRNVQVLVAVFALLLFLGTTAVSAYWASAQNDAAERRLRQQEIHDAKVELRALLQRLQAIPGENVELYSTDADPLVTRSLGVYLAAENALLTNQALAIIDRIPDQISTLEYVSVGNALGFIGNHGAAQRLYERAIEVAKDAYDHVGAHRSLAMSLMTGGDVEGGRDHFDEALTVAERYPSPVEDFAAFMDTETEMLWASTESAQNQCAAAKEHAEAARRHATALEGPGYDAMRRQVTAVEEQVATCQPA